MNRSFEKNISGDEMLNKTSNSSLNVRFFLKTRGNKRDEYPNSRVGIGFPIARIEPNIFQNETGQESTTVPLVTKNTTISAYQLCGFPTFCSLNANETCSDKALKDCQDCNMTEAVIFAAICIFVGFLIILGNGMVILNVILKRKGFKDSYSKIRASLAVADILSGLQVLTVILYNFFWTIESTAHEIDQAETAERGSPNAIVGGIFFLLGFTSSLYHLVFLSSQRLYAIAMPIRYKVRSNVSVYVGLTIVWTLAIVSASFPAWFPDTMNFAYYHTLYMYFPTALEEVSTSVPGLVSLVLLLFFPFILMTGLSLASGAMVRVYYTNRAKKLTATQLKKNEPIRASKHEVHILKTIAVMQGAFTITILPLAVSTAFFYADILTCDNFSTPHFICFYLSLSHSFVNVLVYIALSSKFRTSIWVNFSACLPARCRAKAKDVTAIKVGTNNNNTSTSQTRSTGLFTSIELKNHPLPLVNGSSEMKRKFGQHAV